MIKHAILAATLLGLSMGLSACATDPNVEQARLDAIDNKNCTDMGFTPNTEPYGNCRLKLKEIRAQQAAEAERNSGVQFGIGLGVSKGF
ncbi:MAG: hypothetical protein Q7T44_07150 [Parvibaculum sp.]|nr:hypothetical protein [Parvibaculum sp.]